jgi:hypothetical protein
LQRATELGETREAQRIRAQLERYRRDVSPPPYRYTPPSNRRTQSKRGSQNERPPRNPAR